MPHVDARLQARQLQIIGGLARGHTTSEIAWTLGLSRNAVHQWIFRADRMLRLPAGHRHSLLVEHCYRTGELSGLPVEQRAPVELTVQTARLLAGMRSGLGYRELAEEWGEPLSTVRTQVKRLQAVMGARSRAHAVALAWQHGLVGEAPEASAGGGPELWPAGCDRPRSVVLSRVTDGLLRRCYPDEDAGGVGGSGGAAAGGGRRSPVAACACRASPAGP